MILLSRQTEINVPGTDSRGHRMSCLVVLGRAWSSECNKYTGTVACGHIIGCLVVRGRAWSLECNKHAGAVACDHNMSCLVVRSVDRSV
jgi:hypothetical protein